MAGADLRECKILSTDFTSSDLSRADFSGAEADTALLSDASRCEAMFGPPETDITEMIDRVAEWVEQGGRSLGKPTHFEARDGKF